MIEFVPYEPWHLEALDLQPMQSWWRDKLLAPGYAQGLANDMAWTGFIDDRVVGCAGFAPQWEGRVIAWALFGRDVPKKAWASIVAKVRREFKNTLQSQGHKHRVEITVPATFGEAIRLANILGFEVEGLMKKYGPDGSDHLMYAKVI